jgi:hypothetical protein
LAACLDVLTMATATCPWWFVTFLLARCQILGGWKVYSGHGTPSYCGAYHYRCYRDRANWSAPLQKLWVYSKDAVELHLAYLNSAEKGAQTHSVMVTDIPGTTAGLPPPLPRAHTIVWRCTSPADFNPAISGECGNLSPLRQCRTEPLLFSQVEIASFIGTLTKNKCIRATSMPQAFCH